MTNIKRKMTTKTKLSLITLSSILAIAGVLLGINLENNSAIYSTQMEDQKQISEVLIMPPDRPLKAMRSGMPFLTAYPIVIQPENAHMVNVDEHTWLQKVFRRGETKITEEEINDFFTVADDGNYFFAVIDSDKISYYEIEYSEIPLLPEVSYMKAYRLDVAPDTSRNIELEKNPWLKTLVENEFRWVAVDNSTISSFNQITRENQFDFNVVFVDGSSKFYDLRYTGPVFVTGRGK